MMKHLGGGGANVEFSQNLSANVGAVRVRQATPTIPRYAYLVCLPGMPSLTMARKDTV